MSNQPKWRKSSYSGGGLDCVELADLGDGRIGVRDSKDPDGPVIAFDPGSISAFLNGVKAGEFDDLV